MRLSQLITLLYVLLSEVKEHISTCLNLLEKEDILDDQVRWEYLKYEVRKFSIKFSEAQAKKLRFERVLLDKKLKNLESNMNNHEEYHDCKTQLEQIYKIKANGVKIRSKCEWYEYGEKSSKFFLNLEKSRAIQGQVRTVIYNDKETNDETEINNHIYSFFNYLYKETLFFSSNNLETYLNTISFLKLTKEKSKTLDRGITENELFIALQSTENNKSPGNDGLTKKVYITFWNEIKTPLLLAIEKACLVKQLSTSQKQAVIKLIEKEGGDKRYIQNWRPISLLNVDVKLISKALAEHLKNVLPEIISQNQNAYVKNRCISEGGRLISDLREMSEVLNKKGFLVTIDIEKAFDSVNHHFLIAILEKIGFGTEFIEWIKVLLNNQESCVINGGKTLKYFKLERETRQGDPTSAYLFIIVLEVVFRIIKETSNIESF